MGFQMRIVENCLSQTKQSHTPQTQKMLFYFYWNDGREIRAKIIQTSTYIHAHICTNLFQLISTVTSFSKTSKQCGVGCRSPRETPPFYTREVEGLLSSCPVACIWPHPWHHSWGVPKKAPFRRSTSSLQRACGGLLVFHFATHSLSAIVIECQNR